MAKFKINEVFDVNTGSLLDSSHLIAGDVPRISARSDNNGIIGRYDTERVAGARHFENFISVSFFGKAFYHPYKASVDMKVHVLTLRDTDVSLTPELALYLVTALNRAFADRFDYGNQLSSTLLKSSKFEIELPVDEDDKIDVETMSGHVKSVEADYVKHVDAYFSELGYPSHAETLMSDDDQTVLVDFENVRTDTFKLGDLFDVLTTKKRFDANKVTLLKNGGHPYVVRTSLNNGQRGRIKAESKYLNDGNTISLGQDTATIFYQPEPYFTGDKIKVLKPKFEGLNRHAAQYMMTVMRKAFLGFSWGSTSFNVSLLKDVDVELPVTEDGKPDVAFMTKYIKVIEKLTVQEVRQKLDDWLEAYKR